MTGRKVLYVLGAGASRGAGGITSVQGGGKIPIPMQADFWQTILRFASPEERSDIESFLFRYFTQYSKAPARVTGLQRTAKLEGIDVEEVFTFLSERSRAPSTSSQLRSYVNRIWGLLVSAVGRTFRRFKPNSSSRSIYRRLFRNHIRQHDAVVSFNYDVLFERSLPTNQAWCYPCVSESSNGLKILKPHGSANWVRRSDGTVVHQPNSVKPPVIVAPTHLKFVGYGDENSADDDVVGYLDNHAQISKIWHEMELQMAKAKVLVFVGYSFPVADLYFSSVLRSVLASRDQSPRVVVVNPDAQNISSRISSRFNLAGVQRYLDLVQFAESNRDSLFRALGL